MPTPLIIPDHIKHARLALLVAGVPVTEHSPAFAALMCAAVAYNRLPQVNRAVELQLELQAARRENERLSCELLRTASRVDCLRPRRPPPAHPSAVG